MIWKVHWKVGSHCKIRTNGTQSATAIGLRGPIFGVVQNVSSQFVSLHLSSDAFVGNLDDLCSRHRHWFWSMASIHPWKDSCAPISTSGDPYLVHPNVSIP